MKECGIIFSDDSVRAILEGRKTQTRRIIKPQPVVKQEWDGPHPVFYRADGFSGKHRWKSSIFMPRRLSRLTLDIISIRCEQLQAITIEDCKAEGFRGLTDIGWRYVFGSVWNQFHEKRGYGWNVNPWVWVISFRRMSDGHANWTVSDRDRSRQAAASDARRTEESRKLHFTQGGQTLKQARRSFAKQKGEQS